MCRDCTHKKTCCHFHPIKKPPKLVSGFLQRALFMDTLSRHVVIHKHNAVLHEVLKKLPCIASKANFRCHASYSPLVQNQRLPRWNSFQATEVLICPTIWSVTNCTVKSWNSCTVCEHQKSDCLDYGLHILLVHVLSSRSTSCTLEMQHSLVYAALQHVEMCTTYTHWHGWLRRQQQMHQAIICKWFRQS